jgi:aldose 1-epimerase
VSEPVVELRAGDLVATYAPDAGMVCTSLRHAGDELLAQEEGIEGYVERGATFGIPLLYPWANRLGRREFEVMGRRVRLEGSPLVRTEEHGLPIHGLLAASPLWRLEEAEMSRLRAVLSFADGDLLAAFQFPHELELAARLDPTGLAVTTTVRATGDVAVPLAFGYHPYLRLPGVPRERLHLGLPVRRRFVLDERQLPTGAEEAVEPYAGPLGDRIFDDGFGRLVPGAPFWLEGDGRRIEVVFEAGYPVAQVFAPPGKDFVCFEPMTAPTNALVTGDRLAAAAPGTSASARFAVRVSRLAH